VGPRGATPRSAHRPPIAELGLLLLIVAGLAHCIFFFSRQGYLPPPFFYDPFNEFMDWYNMAYWAHTPGAYEIERSIYAPLSFVFLKIFSIHACYARDPILGRACDWEGRAALLGFFLVNAAITFACFRRNDRRTALVRTTALTLGFPVLFGLDIGNLIIPAFTCFALAFGGLLRSARARWLAIALAVNFKPYLVLTMLPRIAKRQWRWVEACGLAVAGVYLLSYIVFASGTPIQILTNEFLWSQGNQRAYYEAFYAQSSYAPLVNFLRQSTATANMMPHMVATLLKYVAPMLVRLGQLGTLLVLAAIALGRIRASRHRLTALCVCVTLTSTEAGVYADTLLLFLVFLERWRAPAVIVSLIAAYLLCVPVDVMIAPLAHWTTVSYLSHRTVDVTLGLDLGSLIRPGLVLIIQYALIWATLTEGPRTQIRGACPLRRAMAGVAP